MAAIVIKMSLNGSGPGVILNDGRNSGSSITTEARNSDTVQWIIVPASTRFSVDGVKDTTSSLFNPAPGAQRDGSWLGTVKSLPATKQYTITYTFNAQKYSLYPKIQVNP